MAEVKWIKIVTDIFDDEKILLIESLPEHDTIIVLWFKLLCLAGKMNNSGVFIINDKIPYTDEMLATIFRRPKNTVILALETFKQFGMIETINNVITIPNWSKYQTLDQIEERNKYMKEYMQKYREKQKELSCKVNSKVNSKVNVNSLDIDNKELDNKDIDNKDKDVIININNISVEKNSKDDDLKKLFDEFWSLYPKKVDKKGSFTSFKRIVDLKNEFPIIVKALKENIISEQWTKNNGQYIPNPRTFINQERWKDTVDTRTIDPFEALKQKYKDEENVIDGEYIVKK